MHGSTSGWAAFAFPLLFTLSAATAALQLAGWLAMSRFIRAHPTIVTEQDLGDYQGMVARAMYAALIIIAMIVIVPIVFLVLTTRGLDLGWFTMSPMLLPLLFRKRISAAEEGMRALPVADAMRDVFDATNRIWVEKALPRFENRLAPAASLVVPRLECAVHGVRRGVLCCRCQRTYCLDCARAEGASATACAECGAHYRSEVVRLRIPFQRSSLAANALSGLGTGDLLAGLVMQSDPIIGQTAIAGSLIVLGIATTTAAVLWSLFFPRGRELSLATLLPHGLLLPIGTVVAVACVWVALRDSEAVSPESARAAAATGTKRSANIAANIGIGTTVALLHAFALVPLVFVLTTVGR